MKKSMKKILSIFLVLSMTVGFMPFSEIVKFEFNLFDFKFNEITLSEMLNAFHIKTKAVEYKTFDVAVVDSGVCGDNAVWTLYDSGTLVITGSGEMTNYNSATEPPWYNYKEDILSVVIETGITTVGSYAFRGKPDNGWSYAMSGSCPNVTSITISDTVTSIGEKAFAGCKAENIVLPNSVTSIGDYAFYGCYDTLKSIEFSENLTEIGRGAFSFCSQLNEITIPNKVTSIGALAFSSCYNLKTIRLGSGVTNIGYDAFENCNAIDVHIMDISTWCNIDFYEDYSSNPLHNGGSLYLNESLITDLVIPDGITRLNHCAFYGCESIERVTVPDSVTSLGAYVFKNCTNLSSVSIGSGINTIGRALDFDVMTEYNDGFCLFENCTNLKDITISDNVTDIQDDVFSDTALYNDVSNWEDGVLYIGNHLIKAETSLSGNYTIKDGTKSIARKAFYECIELTSIVIPSSVKSISYRAFDTCKNLSDVYICNKSANLEIYSVGYTYLYTGNKTDEDYYEKYPVTIHAEPDSLAEDYCKDNDIDFVKTTHDFNEWIIDEATCLTDGLKYHYCDFGDCYEGKIIPATGHTWGNWMVATEPTVTADGSKARFCTSCENAAEIEVIPATGSGDEEKTGITITLTDENGNVIIKEVVSDYNTDISFENGTYTLTISKENYVSRTYIVTAADNMMSVDFSLNKFGDMNGDGRVNTVDVARANAHAKGISTLSGYDFDCVDINGDGRVNTVDVAKMNAHAKGVSSLW